MSSDAYTKTLIQKLDSLNQKRIEQAIALMDSKSRRVFHLIPTLLHFNHPTIPGYYDSDVPFGIYGFQFNEIQQKFISDIELMIDKKLRNIKVPAILGLYTMGSTSSIGQNTSSDLDIWVTVSSKMNYEQRNNLTKKCLLITNWAKTQKVEANFFLMDEKHFRGNNVKEMTCENCGSAQHVLLLDEFYRSAVRLAGKRLLWQIVPPEMEEDYDTYTKNLCKLGYINSDEWIDFGKLNHIPAEEYFGSNLWQLYKSIDSPYKSVLKAILLEAYSWEYPNTKLLSINAKYRFFSKSDSSFKMDPYYLMLEKVTNYLKNIGDHVRLNLVRYCFYLKTHEKLSQILKNNNETWRRRVLIKIIHNWNWDEEIIQKLDNHRNWKIEQVKKVHNTLLDALMLSYRKLINFARRNNITSAISPRDITILARKLYSAFEVLPSKITLLNPKIAFSLNESDLTFIEVQEGGINQAGWYLYNQPLIAHRIIGQAKLEYNKYLSKLVAWAFFNGVIIRTTRLHSVIRNTDLDLNKFTQMVSNLFHTFSSYKQYQPNMHSLVNPCEIKQMAIFINFEYDPTTKLSHKPLKINFKNTNVFSFGENKKNLVGSIDLIYRNSWNEVRTFNFQSETAILDTLKIILNKINKDALSQEAFNVFCYSKSLRGIIRTMVYQLLLECIDLRLKSIEQKKHCRFKAICIAKQMYGLFFEYSGVSIKKLENSTDFYQNISNNRFKGLPVLIIEDQDTQLPSIIKNFASEGLVQFFFEDTENSFNIYVLDEFNKVEIYRQLSGKKDQIIADVSSFYTLTETGHYFSSSVNNLNFTQYYQIVHSKKEKTQIIPYR
ncbi:class I adenylate cyclase [Candidatus Photodesmus anomalopis]|uniref:Adenylate cyclase n=1 Tax=Candidatus Photodesmus katoptron Akat1 TaxID=1236703 RepID=S3DZW2_9GAMM|nr:class I adenylate cyclase [Candidatus Photodesmus katoptron]EPE37506.1 adenylate cyclase [Candidatus Photodesmus katoptron Akat1]